MSRAGPRSRGGPGCPVCRARLRGTPLCSRCGADLTALMRVLARAHRLRAAAVEALTEGMPRRALELAESAQRLRATTGGWRLSRLAAALEQQGG